MQAMTLSSAFVLFLALSLSVRLWLAARQIRHVASHRNSVPPQFVERIPLQAHRRAADYTVSKVRLGILDNLLSTVVVVALTLLGGLQWLSGLWAQWLPEAPLLQQIAIVVSVVVLTSLIEVPMDAYRQFRLEAQFGFNRMTPGLFAADLLKSAALGAAIGIPLLSAVLWLMQRAGDYWWLWTWVLWTVFNVVILLVYPTLIAPLFNKFKPLEAGAVRSRVENLLHRCGFAANGLFVMDGSRRSAHGNAYFTGFGKGKRIVFFDTLLSRLDVDEIEAVLAHELGHFKKRHIIKRLAFSFVASLVGLALLGYLSRQPWFYQGLGVNIDPLAGQPGGIALLLFFLALPAFTFVLRPLLTWFSRKDEFEADAFAASLADPGRLTSALVKLYEDNASTLTPDPVHSAFYDSHPPAAIRIDRLSALATPA
ncbi:MAG TPA: M48 family metallopeptidase [Lautropia sp.]|nr:M48 family metallopeptidase [Lautropia sp.]